ncbi:MAG: MCP four helix bundle domain-containing protein [Bdellovibrionaceae bacterium]|nr:MCP four helix bundle domain-containing protein [Pseudobdellovibrionaceae bacterium]
MNQWGLSKKIWSVLGLLSFAFAFVFSTVYALHSMNKIQASMNIITGDIVKRDQLTSEIQDNQRQMTIAALETLAQSDLEKMKKSRERYDATGKEQDQSTQTYRQLASEKGKAFLDRYLAAMKKWDIAIQKSMDLAQAGKDREALDAFNSVDESRVAMRNVVGEMNELTASQLAAASAEANEAASRALWISILIAASSILVSLAVAFIVLRVTNRAISEVVRNLSDGSTQVSAASAQIASAAEELSQATTEQAASLGETAAAIEEMNSMVGKNSENARSTSSTSVISQQKAGEGKSVVEKMISSMDEINTSNNNIMEQVNQSNARIAEIVNVIEEIGNKTKVINDIVFQTKLLSFNASVEAARAGEHGKGFAVVAEEVGNLAQMSGNAAKEISSLLEESVNKVNSIVSETKTRVEKLITDGRETVESGAQVARQCGEVLDEIVQNVSNVSSMANEISSASQEQSRGVTEITRAMGQLDQVTQQNAATSEEAASAAEELSAQAEAMRQAVAHLVVTIEGGRRDFAATSAPAPTPAKTPAQKTATAPSAKVVPLNREPAAVPAQSFKKAAGDGTVPSYDDKGFNE